MRFTVKFLFKRFFKKNKIHSKVSKKRTDIYIVKNNVTLYYKLLHCSFFISKQNLPLRKTPSKAFFKLLLREFSILSFFKSCTCCLLTVARTASFYIYMICIAFAFFIVHTVSCFAVNTDCSAWIVHCITIRVRFLFTEAFTTGFVCCTGTFTSYGNITLTTQFVLVVTTICNSTF